MLNIEEIKSAIIDREEQIKEKFRKEKIIEREEFNKVKKLAATDTALVITGPRRCGKSILAFMLSGKNNYGYVNFEDERLILEVKDLNKVLEAIYSLKGDIDYLIFDEIQNIPKWEHFISRLIQNKKVIITGSNSRLLSKELSTFLTGRHIDFTLLPFSFREFLKFKDFKPNIYLTKDIAKTKNYFYEYSKKGGFPLAYKQGKFFLSENYRDIIERDVVQRYKVKYIKVLKELARYLISNTTNEISFNKLKDVFKIKSVHTLENYVYYLENAYLIFLIKRFSFKLKEQELAPKKVYSIDTGLANVLGFKFSENKGKVLENLVAIELLRKSNFNNYELYYWKDYQQREVDFVIKKGKTVSQLIQVTSASARTEIIEREIKALIKASKELKCKNLLVITYDYEGKEQLNERKIKFIPLWKWLLI